MALEGKEFSHYRVLHLIGRGGMGEVYLLDDLRVQRQVAAKFIRLEEMQSDQEAANTSLRLFWREATAIARLDHPSILPLYDHGEVVLDGASVAYFVMPYRPDGSLVAWLRARARDQQTRQLTLKQIAHVIEQTSQSLQYAHDHQVMHLDVKPANFLIQTHSAADDFPDLLLSDFGIARLATMTSHLSQNVRGTPTYMSPEQCNGQPTFVSDQYALAIMAYELLTGRPPFVGNPMSVMFAHVHQQPPSVCQQNPLVPTTVDLVLQRALAKRPDERFSSIATFAHAFVHAFQGMADVTTLRVLRLSPATPPPRRPVIPTPTEDSRATLAISTEEAQDGTLRTLTLANGRTFLRAPRPSRPFSIEQQNRERLMRKVRKYWIKDVFEHSLHHAAPLMLGLRESPEALAHPWHLVRQESRDVRSPLLPAMRITEVYDSTGAELLILGEPGAGKTTLLLELTRDLLKRAEQDLSHPIPVVFSLSSWAQKHQPLAAWFIEELETKYQIPKMIGSSWVKDDQILPLLDGLDEVTAASRAACIQAINEYHQEHNLVSLVVCCRVNDYMLQVNRLTLDCAVTIQPLNSEQINAYLVSLGEQVTALHNALQSDSTLRELATTPLMLTMLITNYQSTSIKEIEEDIVGKIQPRQIFATYIQSMLLRRDPNSHYTSQQTIHWLSYLAQQMKQRNQSIFYLERMQPGWLPKKWQFRLYYGLISGPICGLLVGLYALDSLTFSFVTPLVTLFLVGWLFGWLGEPKAEKKAPKASAYRWSRVKQSLTTLLEQRLAVGMIAGFIIGTGSLLFYLRVYPFTSALSTALYNSIYMGLAFGLAIRFDQWIKPTEAVKWSWSVLKSRSVIKWLVFGISAGLIIAVPFTLRLQHPEVIFYVIYSFLMILSIGLVIVIAKGVTGGLSKHVLGAQYIRTPNQGIWSSVRYGVGLGLFIGVSIAVLGGAYDYLNNFWIPFRMGTTIMTDHSAASTFSSFLTFYPNISQQQFWIFHTLWWGLNKAVMISFAAGLYFGISAYVQHFVLRFLLWRARCVPFFYPHFLDYAAERIILCKVGGGYIFVHRLLLEHFASLEEDH